jgi:membrane protease YdiL (CAAX protease family)
VILKISFFAKLLLCKNFKMNKKRNLYVFLTFLCLLAIIAFPAFLPISIQKEINLSFDKIKLQKNPNVAFLEIMLYMYIAILLIGFVNLILFVIRNFKKGFLQIAQERNCSILSEEKASRLIFLVIFFILLIYILEASVLLFNLKINLKGLFLFLNLSLQIGVIFIILKFISLKSLNFKPTKECFNFAVKAYITVLPVITVLLFINYLILEKIGVKSSANPAVGLFLTLKNNFLISVLTLQIILFGPLTEELFFRGFLYNLARQKYGFILSAGLCSFIFTLPHKTPQEIFPLFALSVVLCYIYERTKNIATPIIFHILHNCATITFLFTIKPLL